MFAEGRFSSEQRNQQAEKNTQGHAQRHAATRRDTPRHAATRHDTTRHDTTRHDTTRHDTTRHDQCHSLGWPSQGASQRSQRLVSNASRLGISRRQSIR